MLKIGTHDDTGASHYVLVDPAQPGSLGDEDVALLDPIQPAESQAVPWMLSDSYNHLDEDRRIRTAWRKAGISTLQLSGAWAFARWRTRSQRCLAERLFRAIVENPGRESSWPLGS
jgi:hypothetical protein